MLLGKQDQRKLENKKNLGYTSIREITCNFRWVVGSWSACNVSCGKGSQSRSVRCWRVLAPGFDSSVHDHLCDYMGKPITSKLCSQVDCGPQWLTTLWNEVI